MTVGLLASGVAVTLGIPFVIAATALISKVLIQIDLRFTITYVVVMLVFMLIVAAISSVVPAASAARLRIATVLRYG